MITVYIAGSGKLATELLNELPKLFTETASTQIVNVVSWQGRPAHHLKSIVVHAGSGRQLADIIPFCLQTHSTLLELSTGSELEHMHYDFPIVICPNTNILMLKFMYMLEKCGLFFAQNSPKLTESHQSIKTSVPGTAVAMAKSLGIAEHSIVSVRDPVVQKQQLNIEDQHLARHAYHCVNINDDHCNIRLQTTVVGETPYASGVFSIIDAVLQHPLQSKKYLVTEFIDFGWL